ncbi:hypothetical protein BsWGS_28416 [Bradybaena similaris]
MAAASFLLSLMSVYVVFIHVDSQNCREGWHFFGGSCYSFGDSQVTWGDAQGICKTFRAKLAEIETPEENAFLRNLAISKNATFTFLGGTDIFDEGVWVWSFSGDNIYPFVDWAPGSPDDANGEDCLTFYSLAGYHWNDYLCDAKGNFICENPAADTTIVG